MNVINSVRSNDYQSDEALLARSIGEPQCFAELVARYEPAFFRKGRNIIKDEDVLTDAVQDALVKIYLNARKFQARPGASFRSWAYRIFLNTCFTVYRREKREKEFFSTLDPELLALAPDEKILSHESRWAFNDLLVLISRLPKILRRVAELHLVEGYSQEEVARLEGASIGTIRTRLHRARKLLQTYVPVT
ncbi:RNA polymerase sigma factor [Candidatus Nomurabacteria bacterium]|nr:RNA polymerase sigma factor [Candidatus Nomurabacteria bacterium]